MENKHNQTPEPQESFPELIPQADDVSEFPEIPPMMAELRFSSDAIPITLDSIPEVPPVAEEPAAIPEDAPAEPECPAVSDVPAEPELLPFRENSEEFIPTEVITSVAGDVSAEEPQTPEVPEQPDPLFDMSLLDDLVPAEPSPPEEPDDQAYRDDGKEFEDLFQAASRQEDKPEEIKRPSQKGRPKRKKGEGLFGIPNILVTVVWLALILVIGMTLGRMLWVCAADVLAFGREDKAVTITIYEADTMEDIVDKLHKNGLIRYKSLFNLYAGISDAEEDIKPGIYDLNTRYDYHALVNFMSPSSSRQVIKLTIPEGYTCRQIFALLEENRICTAVDLGAYAANGQLSDYWFLEGVERGNENALEGYLFPDTYEFYKNSTPKEALEKMLDNFNHRFTEEMRLQLEALNANVTGGGYTVREITIIASLIEKESAAPAESANISGVIYNRLFNWDYPALLNIDAAIVYAQGGEADTIDTSLDSPYNTYTHVGLTPGPIANPGLASLQAALNPVSHNYYYYVLNPETGMHAFSTTQDEHNANIAAFYE